MHETSEIRTSDTAFLPADDPVVQRIISRASTLQGYTPLENHEQLQLTRYKAGQQYKEHWDHLQDEPVPSNMSQRATTIFAILEASCEECGTRFPLLSVDWSKEDPRWCQYIDCNTNEVTIRPIPGNALFWKNLNVTNNGEYRTLHAGLPPLKGTKVGLNIWTCEKPVTL
jgi:prolyl 4-hydroxylase